MESTTGSYPEPYNCSPPLDPTWSIWLQSTNWILKWMQSPWILSWTKWMQSTTGSFPEQYDPSPPLNFMNSWPHIIQWTLPCTKKLSLSNSFTEVVRAFLRDCAPQKNNYQTYDGTQWRMNTVVEETVYVEGCHRSEPQEVKTPSSEYCYCSGNLCNGAKPSREASHHHTDAMAVIFVFNAMKYIRSLR